MTNSLFSSIRALIIHINSPGANVGGVSSQPTGFLLVLFKAGIIFMDTLLEYLKSI
nr:MAG TPA: hypothetical protein [Caudoviricetes sp.]